MMIGAGQPIGYDDRPVRYRSRQMNPEGTKPQGSSFSSELIAIHGVTFHGAAAVSWVQLVQLSVGGWFIWSLGFSCVLRSCPTHVHSIFHHFIILLILYLPAPLFTISCSCNNCPFHAEIWGQYNLAAAFRKPQWCQHWDQNRFLDTAHSWKIRQFWPQMRFFAIIL